MATQQVQARRGTSTQLAAFTPAQGEAVVDDTNNRIVVGDGTTLGGWPAAKLAEVITQSAAAPPQSGRFQALNATTVQLAVWNGAAIKIAGTVYQIPAAGITSNNTGAVVNGVAGQNLAATTLYYAYIFNSTASVLTIDFSTTAHGTDATAGNVGVEIKNGDNTRTLVGLVFTSTLGQFVDNVAHRQVASWFNRQQREINLSFPGSALSTSTGVAVALSSTSNSPTAVNWVNEAVFMQAYGQAQIGSSFISGLNCAFYIALDSTVGAQVGSLNYAYGTPQPFALTFGGALTPAEGMHNYLTITNNAAPGSTSNFIFNANWSGFVRG